MRTLTLSPFVLLDDLPDLLRDICRAAVQHFRAFALRRYEHLLDSVGGLVEIAGLAHVDLFFLRLLDRPQRRVAGFVDPRLDREERRGVHLDHVEETAFELPVDRRLALCQLDLRHDGHARQVEELGEHRPGRGLDRVRRLDAGEHEVGILGSNDFRERPGYLNRVELAFGIDADASVGSHGEATPHRLFAVYGPDGDDHDLAVTGGLAEAQGLLGRIGVPLVEDVVEVVGIDVPLVVGELDFVAEDGDLLDRDYNFQAGTASRSITARSRLKGSGTSGLSESISRASRCPSKMQSAVSRGATQSPIR
jgi:hypothetical protein